MRQLMDDPRVDPSALEDAVLIGFIYRGHEVRQGHPKGTTYYGVHRTCPEEVDGRYPKKCPIDNLR